MTKLTKEQLPWFAVTLFAGIAAGALFVSLSGRTRPAAIVITPPSPTATRLPDPTQAPIKVYISGEVVAPAVYELPAGAIVQDAIEAAGGMTSDAAVERVNLALPLSSGMHIHIPTVDQAEGGQPLIDTSGSDTILSEGTAGQLINLNTASMEELERLPGIGPSTAQKIIDYREANGPFSTVEDIQNVSGIGPGKLEQIQDLVTVD
jgi:competence protein ComEA